MSGPESHTRTGMVWKAGCR